MEQSQSWIPTHYKLQSPCLWQKDDDMCAYFQEPDCQVDSGGDSIALLPPSPLLSCYACGEREALIGRTGNQSERGYTWHVPVVLSPEPVDGPVGQRDHCHVEDGNNVGVQPEWGTY